MAQRRYTTIRLLAFIILGRVLTKEKKRKLVCATRKTIQDYLSSGSFFRASLVIRFRSEKE